MASHPGAHLVLGRIFLRGIAVFAIRILLRRRCGPDLGHVDMYVACSLGIRHRRTGMINFPNCHTLGGGGVDIEWFCLSF